MKTNRAVTQVVGSCLVSLFLALGSRAANADVSIVKTDDWEVFTGGRVNGFFSFGAGDAYPVPAVANSSIRPGGGLDVGPNGIPATDATGTADPSKQGTFRSMRIRSGFVPNVFGMGLRSHISSETELTVYISFWTTIEALGLRKTNPIYPDAREGYAKLHGPWGTLLVGRALDLFSRGATENDFMYAHGYAVGFPGNIDNAGPTAGLIGFGVLAAFFSPGIVYSTPPVGGLQLNVGLYDPVPLPGAWERTSAVRPESELTFDAGSKSLKVHLFANGTAQQLFRANETRSTSVYGVGYGGRLEVGPVHLGVAGHYGRGLGLSYALENSPTTFNQNYDLRTFDGYSAVAQFVAGRFDLNLAGGMSRVFLLESDKVATDSSLIKTQLGMGAVVVYHFSGNLHFSADYFRGQYSWYLGEKQNVNFLSTGMTATW